MRNTVKCICDNTTNIVSDRLGRSSGVSGDQQPFSRGTCNWSESSISRNTLDISVKVVLELYFLPCKSYKISFTNCKAVSCYIWTTKRLYNNLNIEISQLTCSLNYDQKNCSHPRKLSYSIFDIKSGNKSFSGQSQFLLYF